MGKIVVLLLLALVAWIAVKAWLRRSGRGAQARAAESMVVCAHCAVNLPQSEAFESRGRFYCSEEHRSLVARGDDAGRG